VLEKIIQFHRVPKQINEATMSKYLSINTRRYSKLLQCIFEEYNENVKIEIDGRQYTDNEIPELLREWCTNRNIRKTLNFSLERDGVVLFGFHDHPCEFFVALSERPFVERLADRKIIRYEVSSGKVQKGVLASIRVILYSILIIVVIVPATVVLLGVQWCYRSLKGKIGHIGLGKKKNRFPLSRK